MTDAQLKAKYAAILEKSFKAMKARDVLNKAVESIKNSKDWERFCELNGMSTDADVDSFLC